MGIAAPVIVREMADWVKLGGGNSGIVGDANHSFGFHVAANELPASDYSRTRDPNGSDGPYVDWDYACAGDFDHKNNAHLRLLHKGVLARLMNGELPMICEFIGKPWADKGVYYWARWNGIKTLQKYTGQGHDHWSHISWYRSRVDQRAGLWVPKPAVPAPAAHVVKKGATGAEVTKIQTFFRNVFPSYKDSVTVRRGVLLVVDGDFGPQTEAWVKEFQKRVKLKQDGIVGTTTFTQMKHYGYK